MAQTPISEQAAKALAERMVRLAADLGPQERAAFEALERHLSMLVATQDVDDTQTGSSPDDRRRALWQQLALTAGQASSI